MLTATVVVTNKLGLHARPSAKLTEVASRYESEVWLTRNDKRINAKSIMGVMMLAAGKGTELLLEVQGADQDEAVKALSELFAGGFGEVTD